MLTEEKEVAACNYTDTAYVAGCASNRVAGDLIRQQILEYVYCKWALHLKLWPSSILKAHWPARLPRSGTWPHRPAPANHL